MSVGSPAWFHRWSIYQEVVFALLVALTISTLASDGQPWSTMAVAATVGCVGFIDVLIAARPWTLAMFWAVAPAGGWWIAWRDANALTILFVVAASVYGSFRSSRIATLATGAYCLVAGVLATVNGDASARHGLFIVTSVLAVFTLTVVLNRGASALIRESARRGALIEELERTRTELAAANHLAGQVAERERLSHEIHDTLAQGLTSLVMLVQTAAAKLEADPSAARERLALAEATARDNLAEARALVGALTPADLNADPTDVSGLEAAIARICARATREMQMPIEFQRRGDPRPVATAGQVTLVRAAQEALANVRKHAKPSAVRVELTYSAEEVCLSVADDGVGFDVPATDEEAGYGLAGIRSRVGRVGGRLALRSAAGQGTTVEVVIP